MQEHALESLEQYTQGLKNMWNSSVCSQHTVVPCVWMAANGY